MKIVDIRLQSAVLPAENPAFRWRRGLPGSEPEVLGGRLQVVTEDGLVGEAETRRGVIVQDLIERVFKPNLLGEDADQREYLWHRVWDLDRRESLPAYALGLVDVALWDLAGKRAGLPVATLLGGYRQTIPAYASLVTYATIDEYLDVASQSLAHGFTALKIHAWGSARADSELIRELRAHVGDDVPLMYDGSAGFDLADAVTVGRALSESNFLWYEEPMLETSVRAYGALARQISVPVLVGETAGGVHHTLADYLCAGDVRYVRTGTHLKGGLTGALRISHLADAFRVRAEVHGGGAANEQLCMAVPNNTYFECRVSGNPIVLGAPIGPDGLLHARTAPGMGYGELPSPETREVLL
ncbi:enolase C-terminal domain-like protein [Psychromicrobium xiongbiense]|uniref:enolase C-terminal domain-like protein n=1 Tax=Psychromicrobium xiongbiense TaxID=3051184 RepID=UPI0025571B1D|nr:enolase C-terminal domain-like protein [Psychromicrobium sp. YIM S02556]